MVLRRKTPSWSDILLRDELFHAGIRHCRTPLRPVAAVEADAELPLAAVDGDSRAEVQSLRL